MKKFIEEAYSEIKAKKWIFLLLFAIILLGLFLRAYHFGYPVVGYHNWKETHYLSEARNFAEDGFFKYGFFVPALDYPQLNSDPSGAHSDTFPFISIVVGLFFKIFGPHITVARAVDLLFGILIIPAMFLFVRRLFKRDDIAIIASVLTAFNPMLVFFAHNTQLQNPGLLFMLFGAYFYLRWHENDSDLDLVFTSIFVALAALNVFTFLLILIPIALTFPFDRIKRFTAARLKTYGISAAILSTVLLWVLYMKLVVMPRTGLSTFGIGLINLGPLYKGQFWSSILNYAADNYTLALVVLAFAGIFAFMAHFFKEKELFGKKFAIPLILAAVIITAIIAWQAQFKLLYAALFAALAFLALPIFKRENLAEAGSPFAHKFMLLYGIGSAFFFLILSEKLSGHSYHQFPIAPFLIISASFVMASAGTGISAILSSHFSPAESAEKLGKEDVFKILRYFTIFLLILVLLFGLPGGSGALTGKLLGSKLALDGSQDAWERQFDTQFFGIDIAGDYIKRNSAPDDRVLFSGGEIMGLLWHADRKGYYGIPDVATIKNAEEKGVKWIVVYMPLGRNELGNANILAYLKENYEMKQMSFVNLGDNNFNGIYFLFKKGGTFDPDKLSELAKDYPVSSKEYDLSNNRKLSVGYITLDEN